LSSYLSEVGVLELWCVARDGGRRWKLEYNVRERPAGVPGSGTSAADEGADGAAGEAHFGEDDELEIEIEGGE
jgi:hypothetical protein